MTTAAPLTERTDARPVRIHILGLYSAGFTDRRIATLAGLAPETVSGFTRPINRAGNRKGIKRRCHADIAAKILAVRAEEAVPGLVDSIGTRRRVEALVALGWPVEHIAHRVGISSNHLRAVMRRPRIYGNTAQAITKAYNDLRVARPERNGVNKVQVKRARNRAAANRWPTPTYWDQYADAINDPDFEPLFGITRREIVAQDAGWIMRTTGVDKAAAAKRLSVDKSYVEHAFRDHPQYAVAVAA